MAVSLYATGLAHARALVAAGKVDQTSDWSFSADDSNALLGDPPDWSAYAKWFLGHDAAADSKTKAAWKYPFGKGGKVYRSALRAIASRASAQGEEAISAAASDLIAELDKPKSATVQRAYSLLTIKSVDAEQRVIAGIATTPSPDRMDDIVEPGGAQFKLPIPLLWQHDSRQPIGEVTAARVTESGIEIHAQLAKIDEPGQLQDRIDMAWQSIKSGLVKGLSIGFSAIETADIAGTYGVRFLKWLWLELSCVTIPANADATILSVKAHDVRRPAASGSAGAIRRQSSPGATGLSRVVTARTETRMKKSYADQIAAFEATRQSKAARMDEIMEKAAETGETLDAAAKEEYDGLEADVQEIDEHITRLRAAETRQKAAAVAVKGADPTQAAASRGGSLVRVTDVELPKGIAFARFVACKMSAFIEMHKGNFVSALEIAKQRYPSHAALHEIFAKTAVAGGTTSASHAYDDLVPYQAISTDFIDYLRPKTIVDRFGQNGIPALRRVPFNIRVGGFTAGTSAAWKGEGKPIALSKATSENITLTWATVAGLTVLTQELMRFSTPSAETALRNDLAAAVIAKLDSDFVDPTKAAVANTSPASITNGVAATAPSGTAAANVRHDLATLLAAFASNNLGRSNLVLIMSDTMAGNIAMMVNTLGNNDFPELAYDANPPRLRGIPVIISEALTAVGSPSTQTIVLVKADEVYLADDGQVTVDASMEASVEMSDAPTQDGTSGSGASLVSFWQSGLIGIRAERVINWKLRRSSAVQYISPAAYAPPTS